ncbi:serine/threonine-protein kinase [Streptomyces sp. NPDC020965]|uniref:serine/threonine-protein kinase n=1 Tax=Streptomyces sp. NPDC020965 TaxID=3365105 RepID=UPI0037881C3E
MERLGGGGMGTVWRARDLALHREVALKEVRPPDPAHAEQDPGGARVLRARVLREARALARIDHPHVVTVHHIVDGGDDTYPWIVMELVAGGSLQSRLDQGTMTPVEAAKLGRDVLSALRAAHAGGIEHRDVKPANVLLRPDGRPVLTDFGIAAIRESTSLTATGSVIGSPDYMAPERIRAVDSGPAADLWSLGLMLYVAVEGRHPLRRGSTLATLAAVLDDDVPPPRHAGPLAPVLTALLVRDPAARPDAETLDGQLAAVAAGSDPVTGPGRAAPRDAVPDGRTPPVPEPTSFHLAPPTPPPHAPPSPTPPSPTPPPYAPPSHTPPPHTPTGAPTVPPAGTTTGSGSGGTTVGTPAGTTASSGRRRAWRTYGTVAVVMLAVAVPVGVMAWELRPDTPDTKDGASASASASHPAVPAGRQPGTTGTPGGPGTATTPNTPDTPNTPSQDGKTPEKDAPDKDDLLTPAAIRGAIAKLKPVMGGTMVTRFVVYPEFITADAPVKGSTRRYDRFSYRDGDVAVRDGAGGTTFPGSKPVDLNEFNWDALPTLLRKADSELGVAKPTSRYLIANPGSTIFNTGPDISVYVSDEYGSGYLKANADGKVVAKYPRAN